MDNLGSSSAQSRVMFTSHTDSIHRSATHTTQKLKRDGDIVTIELLEPLLDFLKDVWQR